MGSARGKICCGDAKTRVVSHRKATSAHDEAFPHGLLDFCMKHDRKEACCAIILSSHLKRRRGGNKLSKDIEMRNNFLAKSLRIISLIILIYITIGLSLEGSLVFLKIGAWLAYWIVFGFPAIPKS